jgi:hypothetical protein
MLENLISGLQLLDLFLQTLSYALGASWLRSKGFSLAGFKAVDDNWREDLLDAADDVTFDYLNRDICDEVLLADLELIS